MLSSVPPPVRADLAPLPVQVGRVPLPVQVGPVPVRRVRALPVPVEPRAHVPLPA